MGRRRFSLRVKVAAALAATLLTLGLAEVVVRILYPVIHLRPTFRPGIYVPDPEVGSTLRPSYSGILANYFAEYPVHTDSLGMRGAEQDPAADRLRVLCLGDSNTLGMGVADSDTLPARLDARLAERGVVAEVWNSGVPGYATREELAMLRRLAPKLRPHVVVLGWLLNDLPRSTARFPRNVLVIDGYMCRSAEAYEHFRQDVLSEQFWEVSRLAQLVALVTRFRRHDSHWEARTRQLYGREYPEEMVAANIAQIAEVHETARRGGAECVVLLYGTKPEVRKGEPHPAARRIRAALVAKGIECLSLTEVFHEAYEKDGRLRFVPRDVTHPDAEGHDLTADALAPLVLEAWKRTGAAEGH